ncbi:MAG: hypothetical protein LV473_18440 [Nitrospira sp.]|nr:hypothetical protein [Nitrospira sp.]
MSRRYRALGSAAQSARSAGDGRAGMPGHAHTSSSLMSSKIRSPTSLLSRTFSRCCCTPVTLIA